MATIEIVVPTHCPECHSKLEILNDTGIETSWCTNPECPGRICEEFSFIGDREILEVDGLGPDMASKLADGYARTVGELFTFANEASDALAKFGEDKFVASMRKKGFSSTVVNMLASLEKAKTASWERWIACMGIPMVSKSLGKIIAKEMKLKSDSMKDLPTLLRDFAKLNIAGMGQRKKELILDWLAIPSNVAMCAELYVAGVRPKALASMTVSAAGTPLAGIAFCVTGEMIEMDRDKLSAMLESLGATKKSGVSKKCTHLIRLDAPGKSKVDAANKLGIPIMDKAWVIAQLAKGGIKLDTNRFPIEED
jgi:DNA ligase (NAD+)